METENKQNFPTCDSPNNDAFEGIVELYYQIEGYITSSGKWFKYNEKSGYQDIDVLAIKEDETVIVSVSTNLKEKLSLSGKHLERNRVLTKDYFERVYYYLNRTDNYKWLTLPKNKVKRVIAVANSPKSIEKYKKDDFIIKEEIEIITFEMMSEKIQGYINGHTYQKIQNQLLLYLQICKKKEK